MTRPTAAPVRVLLPPSEAKSAGGRGQPLGRRAAGGPLAAARDTAFAALSELLAGDPAAAATTLHLPASTAARALADNAALRDAPTTAAIRRYTGVVYQGLGFADLSPAARRCAERHTVIFSGLFGVLRGSDPVPAYRVPAKATLPGLGPLAAFWRAPLAAAVPALLGESECGLVLDLRSSDYAAMWRPDAALRERVVTVRVLSAKPGGGSGVISHPSKLGKGRLAAAVHIRVASGRPVRCADDVAEAWIDCGGSDAEPGPRRGAPHLDLYL